MSFEVIDDGTDRKRWLSLRREGIGASDAAAVLGFGRSSWSSKLSVYVDKVLEPEEEDESKREWLRWGKLLEPLIIAEFEYETLRTAEPDGQLLRSLEFPFMQCTLDARQYPDPSDRSHWGILEAKNTRFGMTSIPEDYWIQLQHQFAVTGAEFGSFAVLIMGSQFFWQHVERDDNFIFQTLIPECKKFWEVVQAEGPVPDAGPSDATLKALKRLYPRSQQGFVKLSGHFTDLTVTREEIHAEMKVLKARKQGIDNQVRAAIGDKSHGVLPSGRSYSWLADKNGKRTLRAPKVESSS